MYHIGLVQGNNSILLQNPAVTAPYKGARIFREAAVKPELETIVEELHITLEGTAAQIEAAVVSLGRWCQSIHAAKYLPEADRVFLQAQLAAGGVMWRSLILRAELSVVGQGPGQRVGGVQGLRLVVERVNYWEDSTEQQLYISSQATGRVQGPVSIYNCWDGTRSNYVNLSVNDTSGDLPAPVRLGYTVNGLAVNGSLYVGQNINSNPGALNPCLQGESAAAAAPSTLTSTANAAASNGAFGRFAWNGQGVAVLSWTLNTAALQSLGGRSFLPLIQLTNAISAGEEFWTFFRTVYLVGANRDILSEGRPAYLPVSKLLHPTSPLALPPWAVESGESPADILLELIIFADDAGAHVLDIDFLYLLPLEYWRYYRMTCSYLGGFVVNDNPHSGTIKSYSAMVGHQAEGPGVVVFPGKTQRYYFMGEATGLTPFSNSAAVSMYYRPRKAEL